MEHHSTSNTASGRPLGIPILVWVLGAGLVIALLAIFVFDVSASTVGYYSLFALFMGSHLFMHGRHGGHGGHDRQGINPDASNAATSSTDEHAGHSGGCH